MNEIFRTVLKIQESKIKIDYGSKAIFIGSCFTENIGTQLVKLKFPVDINPFGPSFNPVSLKNSLEILLNNKKFTGSDLEYYNGLWFSYNHHSSFSNINQSECIQNINERISYSSELLKSGSFLFITFGTSWIYELKETGQVVSNCHKLPSGHFNRRMVSVEEIVSLYEAFLKKLLDRNPNLKIIFTVSPIRHLNDGFVGNMLSKANLIVAIHRLTELFREIDYFPAFEIVMDDLRDYRFYADDMVHPNETAINYIWDQFAKAYISDEAIKVANEVEKIILAINHRPFEVKSTSHQDFLKAMLKKIEELEKNHPYLRFNEEKNLFTKQLI